MSRLLHSLRCPATASSWFTLHTTHSECRSIKKTLKKKSPDILKQRSPFRRALGACVPLQLYSECENKLPPHEPDSKLLSTGQKQDKIKLAANAEHGECQNRRGTDTRCLDENTETDAQISACANFIIRLSSLPLAPKPAHSFSHKGSLLSSPNLCNWRECGSVHTATVHQGLQSM